HICADGHLFIDAELEHHGNGDERIAARDDADHGRDKEEDDEDGERGGGHSVQKRDREVRGMPSADSRSRIARARRITSDLRAEEPWIRSSLSAIICSTSAEFRPVRSAMSRASSRRGVAILSTPRKRDARRRKSV